MTDVPEPAEPDATPRLIAEPADGVPRVTDTPAGLEACAAALAAGTGPVAVDAERASGIRYGQRAMLVQLKREGAGIWLVDPEALDGLEPLQEALSGVEWILHAASQDLPCLAEQGLRPDRLFDTELAARVAGLPRVGLAAVLESMLGVTLAKEHSAADWSVRPLPEAMLAYAALDVELLVPLRAAMLELLEAEGKREWAEQEFEHVRTAPAPGPRADPWRRTSGSQTLRRPVQRAVLKRLWEAREDLARHRDVAPGRLIPDRSLIAAAESQPRTVPALRQTSGFHGRAASREAPLDHRDPRRRRGRRARRRPARPGARRGRPAPAPGVEGPRPARRPPPEDRQGARGPARRAAGPAHGEPAHPGHPAPALLGAAAAADARGRGRVPPRARGPALAGGPGGRGGHRGPAGPGPRRGLSRGGRRADAAVGRGPTHR